MAQFKEGIQPCVPSSLSFLIKSTSWAKPPITLSSVEQNSLMDFPFPSKVDLIAIATSVC